MSSLRNGVYCIRSHVTQSQSSGPLFVGIDTRPRREQRSGHIKEGTPIILVPKHKMARVEVQKIEGDNYRLSFLSHEASGMNLGCDKNNLQKNNKVFVTKKEVEWALDKGNHEKSFHVQVRESGMYMTVPEDAKENTQLVLEQLQGEEGQEWEFIRIDREE
ncbi:unnamed protein product [Rhizoctonia solani]|uniref:Ricin-type beta-trefoil lectin domain protein n=1 Tax=Rhizoctonia solani TaxID=456999 RepID=A0A8H7H422_9AGAM|nr:ricin-type beta-trefoil lectin domain protein [Rhizoctonia solani]KAF8672040.1 hypothetical protein RHS04_07918 [Rhizoctonia solani]KAF8749004.1 hypothetical protein RHS01_10379 [Rhizoctonia solani]QRW23163.1 ricin-type beta-trefoil lectin domain protein [Rhizoctonia solani]CAE6363383.1 unnamed protein product [Rhizoctonia solani]